MARVRPETLRALVEEFPCAAWEEADLAELTVPRHGAITGFARYLAQLEALARLDLGETGPAGPLRRYPPRR